MFTKVIEDYVRNIPTSGCGCIAAGRRGRKGNRPCIELSTELPSNPCGKIHSPAITTYTSVTCAQAGFSWQCKRQWTKYHQNDDAGWDRGREGYLDVPQKPVYAPVPKPAAKSKGQGLIS